MPAAEVRLDGVNELVQIADDGHFTGAEGSIRASLVFDGGIGRLFWSSRERSGSTGEWAERPLTDILSIVGGDSEAANAVINATQLGKRLARKRIDELRLDGRSDSLRLARKLEAAVNNEWLRLPRQTKHR
jgi:hypothetical protein